LVWLLGWGLSSRWSAATVARESVGSQLAYSVLIWIGAVLLLVLKQPARLLLHPFSQQSTWLDWLGLVLVCCGLGFATWARVHLGKLWSAQITLKQGHQIIRSGPYRIVRHPIYTGILVAIVGTVLIRNTLAALLALPFFITGFVLKLRQEERLLLENFGPAYRAYQADVPPLIPRP
jgi:protein-S-isoprenylcysteine O-methyltransferase Ste14